MFQKESSDISNYRQNLLITLYHQSLSIPYNDTETYSDLHQFRNQIEIEKSGPHHKPYEAMQKQALNYRVVFMSLGLIFLLLGVLVYQHSINWLSYSLIFSSFHTAKTLAYSVCFLFALGAFGIAYSLRAEREAQNQLINRAKRKLHRILRKKMPLKLIVLSKDYHPVKVGYERALDKINESKEVTTLLFQQISYSHHLNTSQKAILFNQSILELNDRLHHIINSFQKTT